MIRSIVNHFNRGEIDQRALTREDVKRVNQSSALMENFIPSRLGNMAYRPGTEYIDTLAGTDHHLVPFISAVDDTAILHFYDGSVDFIVNDTQIDTTSVTTTVVNSSLTTDTSGWTSVTSGGAVTGWYSFDGDGGMSLTGDGTSSAGFYQTIATVDTGSEHFLVVNIVRAPVIVKIGDGGDDDNIYSGELRVGYHFLAFTPASSNLKLTFSNFKKYEAGVTLAGFFSNSTMTISTALSGLDLSSVRYVQSLDVVYCAANGAAPFQIEHRGDKSWSVVDFRSDDGPFDTINTSAITMTPASIIGDTTLTASEDYFTIGNIGQLFKHASNGQEVQESVSVDTGAGTGAIRVTGVGSSRVFTVVTNGHVSSTVTLQRSFDGFTWDDVESYTTNQNKSFDDTFDNSIFYYRLYVIAGDNPTPDTLTLLLTYDFGSIEGICRVTEVTSSTVAKIQILKDFGNNNETLNWTPGAWMVGSYPSTVELAEGRLWFGGDEEIWGSVSDAYYSFDRSIEGDSASILRTIGFGPSDPIKWIKSANQLILGTSGDEIALRSSSYGEILTQSTANVKSGSTQGSDNVEPIKIDGTIYFVQRAGNKIYSLDNTVDQATFGTLDATILNQSICAAGIHRMAITRQPETRIFAVLDDGNAVVYTVDTSEDVAGWSRFTMDDDIKDVVVLPSADEDSVYFVVERGASTYLEKMAKFKDSIGGTTSETFDSFLRYTSPGTSIAMAHIANGETVGVWADGQDRGTYTIAAGVITVGTAWTDVIVGVPYVADYTSNKLSGYDTYTVLTEQKRIVDTGLVLMNYWPGSLSIGPSVALLKGMPAIEDGTDLATTATISDYSELPFEFDGQNEVDPRIYMRATGPVTILALSYGIEGERGTATSD